MSVSWELLETFERLIQLGEWAPTGYERVSVLGREAHSTSDQDGR